jgi:hypothetical protein
MYLYNNLLHEFQREQMGYSAIAIIGQSCIGSVAAMFILMNEQPTLALLLQLFLVTILTMGFNAAVLAQLKTKLTFNLLIISVGYSILTILANSL